MLTYPIIDPIAFSVGPLHIRWYALAYLAGFILGWRYCLMESGRDYQVARAPSPKDYDDFLTWAIFGVILGGRIGYVLFYNLPMYARHPLEALQVWHGGMSFHGGLMGVVVAAVVFSRMRRISTLAFGDLLCAASTIGLFFGRIANFINGELYGHATGLPWGMVFPNSDGNPRHPSQLYEAALEGIVLFLVLNYMARQPKIRQRPGMIMGAFCVGYALIRMLVEFWRIPDAQLGYLWGGLTMGQWLSLPMCAAGAILIAHALKAPPAIALPPAPPKNDDTADDEPKNKRTPKRA